MRHPPVVEARRGFDPVEPWLSQLQFVGEHDRLAFFERVVVKKLLVPAFVLGERDSTLVRIFATEAGSSIQKVGSFDLESSVVAWLSQFFGMVLGLTALLAPLGQALGRMEYVEALHSSAGKSGGGMLVQVAIVIQQTTSFKQPEDDFFMALPVLKVVVPHLQRFTSSLTALGTAPIDARDGALKGASDVLVAHGKHVAADVFERFKALVILNVKAFVADVCK